MSMITKVQARGPEMIFIHARFQVEDRKSQGLLAYGLPDLIC